jgi:membrane-associated phospholipid phosphatase
VQQPQPGSAPQAESTITAPVARRRPAWTIPALVGGYLAAVTLFMVFVLHLSVSPERLLLLMLIAALVLGRARLFLSDWIPFLVLFLSYEYLRGLSSKAGFPVHHVTGLEQAIAFGHVPTLVLQHAFYHPGHISWYDIAATMFYFLHFAMPLAVGYLFWVVARPTFLRFSRTLLGMSFAAFFFFLLVPVAPPWAAVPGVVKIINHTLPSYTDIPGIATPATVYHFFYADPNAAMPSMHAAYPFLASLFGLRLLGRRSWPLFLYTACVWYSIVYLGEHYVVDIIGGVIFALAAFYADDLLNRWWAQRQALRHGMARVTESSV